MRLRVLLILILGVSACSEQAPERVPELPPTWDRGENALWLRRRWLHEARGDNEVLELARVLRARGISRAYPFVGPPGEDGRFGWRDNGVIHPYDEATARSFFERFKRADPNIKVLPWTGGVLNRDVHLDNEGFRDAFVAEARALVALGADGIHLNIEPMTSYAPGYLELLGRLDEAISPALVSVAAYPPPTPLHPYEDVHWTTGFLSDVCARADEVNVMAYDTSLTDGLRYRTLMSEWTAELAAAFQNGKCKWWIGVPAYEDIEPWHDPRAESLENALQGILKGLSSTKVGPNFAGVALYASWTIDSAEWGTYDGLWRQVPAVAQPLIDADAVGPAPIGK